MKSWRITWRGATWTEADATGDHLALVVAGIGADTWDLEPTRGPVRLMAWLAAFVALADQRTFAAASAEVRRASAAELVAALTIE